MRSKIGVEDALTRTQRARRQDIVAAAISVINSEGYATASIERIARAAASSKGTVLYHFKTKEAVNEAVVRLLYDNGAACMTERITAAESYRDRLRVYLSSDLHFIADNTAHVRAVHRILENAGSDIEVPDGVLALRQLLASGQQHGEFGEFDPHVVAMAVRAVVDAASLHFTAHPQFDVEHYIAEVVQLFDKVTKP
ncbi:TetR/AcrR family transcriptional regulator [Micromonospora rubida]